MPFSRTSQVSLFSGIGQTYSRLRLPVHQVAARASSRAPDPTKHQRQTLNPKPNSKPDPRVQGLGFKDIPKPRRRRLLHLAPSNRYEALATFVRSFMWFPCLAKGSIGSVRHGLGFRVAYIFLVIVSSFLSTRTFRDFSLYHLVARLKV